MGASIGKVVLVVSSEVVLLMGISVILAWITAYFFMQNWLQDFPFNIGFRPWIYLVSAIAAMLVAIISVSLLACRAAMRNPARILHYE